MTLNVSCGCLHLLSPTSPTRGNWGSSRGHYHQMQGVLLTPSPPPGKGSAGHSWERRGNQTGWLGMCVGTTHFTGKENQFHFKPQREHAAQMPVVQRPIYGNRTIPTTRTPCGPSLWHQDEFTLSLLTGFPEASQWSSAHEKHPLPSGDPRVCWARHPDPLSLRVPFREAGEGCSRRRRQRIKGLDQRRPDAGPDLILSWLCCVELSVADRRTWWPRPAARGRTHGRPSGWLCALA